LVIDSADDIAEFCEEFMSDRKYRQPGYQDRGEKREQQRDQTRPKESLGGPRPIQMAATRTVSRCANCGVILQALTEPLGNCPKCGSALHSCKQCTHFEPSAQNECREKVPVRIAKKDAANDCTLFQLKRTFEKETSSTVARVTDARQAFENLFKK